MKVEPLDPSDISNVHSKTTYSICVTNRNNVKTLSDSLDSILSQIDKSFELIVVDAHSDDGSEKVLKEYQESEKIKLISKKCSRGQGRQIALENSSGAYVISHIDTDDVYRRRLLDLIALYHIKCEGKVMVAISSPGDWTQNVTIGPREFLMRIGGWRNLQWGDDWDLWSRAAMASNYSWTVFPMSDRHRDRQTRSGISKTLSFRFRRYRDGMSIGRDLFRKEEQISLSQKAMKFLAKVSLYVYPSSLKELNGNFMAADPACFVS